MSALWRVPQYSVKDAVALARVERLKRGLLRKSGKLARSKVNGTLLIPQWVKRDRALYARVKSRSFRSQHALDTFLVDEAAKRGRTHWVAPRAVGGQFEVEGYACAPVKRDR